MSGDPTPEAWAAVLPHLDALTAHLVRVTRSGEDAEDAAQTAIMRGARLWRPDVENVRAWLLVLGRNVLRDAARRESWYGGLPLRGRGSRFEGFADPWHMIADPSTDEEEAEALYELDGRELHADEALALLDQAWAVSERGEEDEELLRGAYSGIGQRELARRVGCSSAGLVKVWTFRAKERTRRNLRRARPV